MRTRTSTRTPVSIVCVFNDAEVLASCLRRSIDESTDSAPQTELIAVDNSAGAFPTAGAALNHGARAANNVVVAFAHQDVVVHSVETLEAAAQLLVDDRTLGVLGAVGIDADGRIRGRMRDRVVQIGDPAKTPRDVDSLDEVLFMVRRQLILDNPISEDPKLAWHAYGVEYALRMRRARLRAAAVDLAITHNSLTTNLARLDEAHERVGELYPELLPVRTTCGTVHGTAGPGRISTALHRRYGAAVWWSESREARAITRVHRESVVLADIRLSIDDALRLSGLRNLLVLDAADGAGAVDGLSRFGVPFVVESVAPSELSTRLSKRMPDEMVLVTGLGRSDLQHVGPGAVPRVVGHWRDTGTWVLIGARAHALAPLWSGWRNRPIPGLRPARATSWT